MMLYWRLFCVFSYVSLLSFGGGTAMIPLFEQLLVGTWITHQQLMDVIALSQATPGAFSINLATYVGFITTPSPYLGAFAATMGHAVIGYFMCISIGSLLRKYHQFSVFGYVFGVLRPISLSLIIWSAVIILWNDIQTDLQGFLPYLGIFVVCYYLLTTKYVKIRLSPILIILLGGILGILLHFIII